MLSYYTITGLINAVTSTVLGFLVYFKDRKSALNRSFTLFCLSVAAWSWAYIFWPEAPDRETTLFWFRVLHIGAIFVPITYFHFVIVFLNLYEKNERALKLGYLTAFVLFLFDFTPLFIRDMVPKFSFRYWAEPGILYHFFLLIFFGYAIYCWYLLSKAYLKSTGTMREQIRYVLLGTLIGFIGGSTNYPLWYNINIPPLGNSLVAIYVILVAVAITKYYLFDIKLILTELLVGIFSILLFVQIFLSNSIWQYLWNITIFIVFLFFGYLFVKSILKEIAIKQKIGEAGWKVLERGEMVSENFKKVMTDREKLLKEWFLSDVNKELGVNALKNKVKELEEKLKEKGKYEKME